MTKSNFLRFFSLNGNELKILACVFMLIDHIGYILFPRIAILRIIGRLAFPIFAFFIAEGCRYTHNKPKYLLFMAILGIAMMIVQYAFTKVIFGNILVCFALSIALIYAIQALKKSFFDPKNTAINHVLWLGVVLLVFIFCMLSCTFLRVDYGFWGVIVPVFVSLVDFRGLDVGKLKAWDNHFVKLILLGIGLLVVALRYGGIQYYSFLALILLAAYNGERGKYTMKYFFYIFYPLHIVLLYGISMLL